MNRTSGLSPLGGCKAAGGFHRLARLLLIAVLLLGVGGIAAAAGPDPEIRTLQTRLGELGYAPGPADGLAGKRTRQALERFQKDQGLPVTGTLDETTKARLMQAGTQGSDDVRDLPATRRDATRLATQDAGKLVALYREQASEAAGKLADPFDRVRAQCRIAAVVARVGDIESAKALLEQAKASVSAISPELRSFAARDISRALAFMGDTAGAETTIAAIPDAQVQVWAYIEVAVALAQTDDSAGAKTAFARAKQVGHDLDPASQAPPLLAGDVVRDDAAGKRAFAERDIAKAQAEAGDIEGAKATAAAIKHAGIRQVADAAISLAELKTKAMKGDIEGAKATARRISDVYVRASAERVIAAAQAGLGDLNGAKATLAQAKNTARMATPAFLQWRAEREIAVVLAEVHALAGEFVEADKTAASIDDEHDYDQDGRLAAELAIAEVRGRAGQRDIAIQWAHSVDDMRVRVARFEGLLKALTSADSRWSAMAGTSATMSATHTADTADTQTTRANEINDPDTATDTPEALNGLTQVRRTLSRAYLNRVKNDESVLWGRIDEADFYGVTQAPDGLAPKAVTELAMANGKPLWLCVKRATILLGQLEFISKPADRQITLSFVDAKMGRTFETSLLAGVSGDSLFYVVLPKGVYQLQVSLIWGQYSYSATADKEITVPGGGNAVYIGHLRMGVRQEVPHDIDLGPNTGKTLFDTGDADSARRWFKSMHPSFVGETGAQQVLEQPIVVDSEGQLWRW
jgi:hypothetical protein